MVRFCSRVCNGWAQPLVNQSSAALLFLEGDPCDFLSATKQFIQLKDRHSSAPINLLWVQGVVSAESFVRDQKFGVAILPDGRSKPIPSEFTVVFGIMRDRYKKSGTLSIPFFSKVSPRAVADRV
ncbi:DUF6119 family protein [Bradyrhizobium sp. WSM1417]|uniref:DUF6119 family protein n=1 Tax=Bradyrhizobium sp. WSM1417 TaxID=754500 RepID=UPI000485FEFC|nr:DUF6119 family protein [Bradyrhizobium sp. WSM1417]